MKRVVWIAVCLSVVLALAGCARPAVTSPGAPSGAAQEVTAPVLGGLDATAAASALSAAGLAVGTITESYSATAPAGALISQDPVPGSGTPKGSTVDLVVSKGPAPIAVPDVVTWPEADARRILTQAGFKVAVTSAPGTATVGTVTAQKPSGTAPPGTSVRITVCSGVLTPDVIGTWKAKDGSTYTFRGSNRITTPVGGTVRYRLVGARLSISHPGNFETFAITWVSPDQFTLALLDKDGVPGKAVTYKRVK